MKPRYSVYRIERAKQRALTGDSFRMQKGSKDRFFIDWDKDDEKVLHEIIGRWDESTGHDGLNKLIDHHEFSHGTQAVNANIGRFVTVDTYPDGAIGYTDYIEGKW